MPEEIRSLSTISLQDVLGAAAEGAIRGIDARRIGAQELIRSGFAVDIHIIFGGIPFGGQRALGELNPQPVPPRGVGE